MFSRRTLLGSLILAAGALLRGWRVRWYRHPKSVGWLGWIEDRSERCHGFIDLKGGFLPFTA